MTAQPVDDPVEDALARCVDVIQTCAVTQADQCGWGTWELDQRGEPLALSAARPQLYDGNSGIAWALRTLGRDAGGVPATDLPPGLLGGSTGVELASGRTPAVSLDGRPSDLGGGLAGDLLALVRAGCRDATVISGLVAALAAAARFDGEGACWPDPDGEVLCGLAHGGSGVVLALVEAAAAVPEVADAALPLAAAGLRWEAAWFDPVHCWPDLRGDGPPTHPVMWCHGAAGIAAVRLRLLQLGLELDYPRDAIAAEAHAGVLACGRELTRAAGLARTGGLGAVPAGLTLCHGTGGPLDVLVLATEVWSDPSHLAAARRIASDLLASAPENPLDWPGGLRNAEGCIGLFVGTAGTALLLARLLDPARIGSLSLLAF
jgi:lantibiotic modifying enzyme